MKKSASVTPDAHKNSRYILKLYVAGSEQNSALARENLKQICAEYLKDRYQLDEVDVLTDFTSALKDSIFVTPTLVLVAPEPRATIVGNLGNKERVISALRIRI